MVKALSISAGDGTDTITGGAGNDIITGGAGVDTDTIEDLGAVNGYSKDAKAEATVLYR